MFCIPLVASARIVDSKGEGFPYCQGCWSLVFVQVPERRHVFLKLSLGAAEFPLALQAPVIRNLALNLVEADSSISHTGLETAVLHGSRSRNLGVLILLVDSQTFL